MSDAGTDLASRARTVAESLRGHKAAMRRHRVAAQHARAELDRIAAECARLGIALVLPADAPPAGPASGAKGP